LSGARRAAADEDEGHRSGGPIASSVGQRAARSAQSNAARELYDAISRPASRSVTAEAATPIAMTFERTRMWIEWVVPFGARRRHSVMRWRIGGS
ncbi:MAG: hypothetical protein ACK56I_16240, partial [bacterium]